MGSVEVSVATATVAASVGHDPSATAEASVSATAAHHFYEANETDCTDEKSDHDVRLAFGVEGGLKVPFDVGKKVAMPCEGRLCACVKKCEGDEAPPAT
jgi:hypothetical protein